jgi:hypothetical protein
MMWAFTASKTASKGIAACNRSALTGMIERTPTRSLYRIDGELIAGLDLRSLQNAQCTGAHGAKSNVGNVTQRPASSLEAWALLARPSRLHGLDALCALLQRHGKEAKAPHEPLTANRSIRHGVSNDRKTRRRRGAHPQRHVHQSPVIRLCFNNRRRAF